MFNKKQIEDQQKQINELKKEVDSLTSSNADLKSAFDDLMKKLEGEDFSKDWEDFNKFKQLKGKLPRFDVLYEINRLKILTEELKTNIDHITAVNAIFTANMAGGRFGGHSGKQDVDQYFQGLDYFNDKKRTIHKQIDKILDSLRKYNNTEEMLELFNIYAISSDWLRP